MQKTNLPYKRDIKAQAKIDRERKQAENKKRQLAAQEEGLTEVTQSTPKYEQWRPEESQTSRGAVFQLTNHRSLRY